MGNNCPSYIAQKPGSTSQAFGTLKPLEIQRIVREKIITLLRVGDIWILVHISIKNYCTQFYKPKTSY
jgi:hypothetical protein